MNNDQFRRLLINNAQKRDGSASSPPSTSSKPSSTPALGSRKQSSVPMTPRHVGRNSAASEFARQLAERNAKGPAVKKWKSSAPKGVKLAAGYTDRTKERPDDENDERVQRIKALEEAMKEGQIDRATFEKLVQEITGGDIASTHLVRGLDRKLLERLRRGEDVQGGTSQDGEDEAGRDSADDALDALEQQEIVPVAREKVEKKGERALPAPVAGVKRTRDALLAELKAQRKAAAEAAAAEHEKKYPTLGPGFRKIGPKGESTRIETDSRGREVLIITDADGNEKRKVRKQKPEQAPVETRYDLDDPNRPVNIPDLPAPPAKEESEDDDIFAGVGSNYNPLDEIEGDDDSLKEEEEGEEDKAGEAGEEGKPDSTEPEEGQAKHESAVLPSTNDEATLPPPQQPLSKAPEPSSSSSSLPRRNYFNDTPLPTSTQQQSAADATVLAALKKVRTMDPNSALLQTEEEARLKKRAAMLSARDRDMEDLDMGFGSSRFDDADEMEREGEKVKLAEWKGLGGENDEDAEDEHSGGGAKKRKRGPKKKKGDKNSAVDVLKVMERQKGTNT